MKAVQLALVSCLLLVAACATGVGRWEGASDKENAAALRTEITKSLQADEWSIIGDTSEALVAGKAGSGGQRTIATFRFADAAPGSTWKMEGGSHHRFNWATFGILGLSMRTKAAQALTKWYDAWIAQHPKK